MFRDAVRNSCGHLHGVAPTRLPIRKVSRLLGTLLAPRERPSYYSLTINILVCFNNCEPNIAIVPKESSPLRWQCKDAGVIWCPEAIDPIRSLLESTHLGEGSKASVGLTGLGEARTRYPEHREESRIFLTFAALYFLRLGSCQWNWVVADSTAAFDWSLMVLVRPPKSRHPDSKISKWRRSHHLNTTTLYNLIDCRQPCMDVKVGESWKKVWGDI